VRARLREKAAGETFYAEMAERGIRFGECFRGVRRLWSGEGEALGEIVTVTDTSGRWELWPWALDACLQVAGAAASGDGLYLPMSVERIELFAPMPETVRSWVQTERLDSGTLSATILVTALDGSVVLRISRLRFRRMAGQRQNIPLYKIEWEPSDLSGDLMAKLADELNLSIRSRAAEKDATDYVAFFEQMEKLSAAYVCEAFLKMGWPEPRTRLTDQDLEQAWHTSPKQRPLLLRMLEIAGEAGAAVRESGFWRFPAATQVGAEMLLQNLTLQYPQQSTELSLLRRCGVSLPDVLTGKVDGRELIFPGGSSEEMEQLYRSALPATIYNGMMADAVVRLAEARNGAVRILEVGGGTGATTEIVLKALREAEIAPEEYLFTDISPLLIRRTRERAGVAPFFLARTFNLEQDAASQGITGRFDIILAANVLHATSDIRATLSRLNGLLTGNGQLLITEVIGKQRWSDLTVGLLDEWWRFKDLDLRLDHPALPAGRWKKVLFDAGFAEVQVVPTTGHGLYAYQELIFAGSSRAERDAVVVGDDVFAEQIALKLRAQLVKPEDISSLQGSVPGAVVWVPQRRPENAGWVSESTAAQVCSLLGTARSVSNLASSPRLYVITRATIPAGGDPVCLMDTIVAGLATGITSERPELRCTRIDVSGDDPEQDAARVATEVTAGTDEPWVARRNSGRYQARLTPLEVLPAAIVELAAGEGIETLAYQAAERKQLATDEVRIAVYATALNFRDVLQASGVVQLDAPLGTDCAGVIVEVGAEVTDFRPGDEVAAIAGGCFASEVTAASALTVLLPAGLSFAQASAQAVPFLTAEFALCEVGGLKSGDRVLIHAAAGGTGLAAVHLCRQHGAEVIATAGSERKRAWLRSLGIREVYDSRSTEFAKQITGGVDIVLNSLAGDSIDAGASLLRPGGRFLELGKTDLRLPEDVERRWPGIRYLPIDLTPLFAARSPWIKSRLSDVLGRTADGSISRLPITLFDEVETKSAFRFMARAEQIGRIVATRRHPQQIRGTHLVVGGMRGIGLRLGRWLAERGARALVFVGRNTPNEEARRVIDHLQTNGTAVRICVGDIAEEEVARRAVEMAGAELRGVWHGAGILDNAPIEKQSWERVRNVLRPKVDGAWNLHRLTLGSELDQFVLFSSWASIAGSHGQLNHCAANAFLDGLAHWRHTQGLPALSINWGAWGEAGAAAEDDVERQLARSGMRKMPPDAALDGLVAALGSNEPQVAVGLIDWPRYLAQRPGRMQRALYSRWLQNDIGRSTGPHEQKREAAHDGETPTFALHSDALAWRSLSVAAREPALIRILAEHVRRVLDLRADEEIDPEMPLSDLGMDSLLAVELRNNLSGVFGRGFPSTLLFDYPNLRTLARHIEAQFSSSLSNAHADALNDLPERRRNEDQPAEGRGMLDLLDAIEQLSDDEVEAILERDERSVNRVDSR
jgi:NADPH:quinone reductase-like Zn-dependent oxidoreductase/acyl carrier protein/ubiquinone/menaquinone biosynthesis C-methylase UbiE/short-subunit dehydrogenase